jgi:hypothetical protein
VIKRCTKCGEEKPATTEFWYRDKGKRDGMREQCKICINVVRKLYRQSNKEKIAKINKAYRELNRDKLSVADKFKYAANKGEKLKRNRVYYEKNREKILKRRKEYVEENKGRILARNRSYRKLRLINDPYFRLTLNLRRRMNIALMKTGKSGKTLELLGCSVKYWRGYLESLFYPGMTWENYGSHWHVDHKRPLASFDLNDVNEQKRAFHWTNTQPLWAKDNFRKGTRWDGECR